MLLRVLGMSLVLGVATLLGCGGGAGPAASAGNAVATPAPPPPGVHRYVIGGDSRDDVSRVVAWSFREAKARSASAFIFLGDMELTPTFRGHFADQLPLLDPIPFFPVVGNHEVKMFGGLPFHTRHAKKKFRERFLENSRTPVKSSLPDAVVYSTDLPGGVHLIALDNVSQKGFGQPQLDWLERDLVSARANVDTVHVIVGMHKALARNGVTRHSMDEDGEVAVRDSDAALETMMRHRVSLIVASHLHQYSRFTQGGIPSYITGGLGAPLTSSGPEHAFHHFLVLDVTEDELRVSAVHWGGASTTGPDEDE